MEPKKVIETQDYYKGYMDGLQYSKHLMKEGFSYEEAMRLIDARVMDMVRACLKETVR